MSIQCPPPLAEFAEFVEATDQHASFHLPLLHRAVRIFEGEGTASAEQRRTLADRLERWRYQMLSHSSGRLTPREQDLADVLDLAANELAGRPARAPRGPRAGLHSVPDRDMPHSPAGGLDLEELEACLNSNVGLDELAQRAKLLTRQHFSSTKSRVRNAECGVRNAECGTPNSELHIPNSQMWRMLLYTPLYLSNYCINHCLYCAFRHPNDILREHLEGNEALQQAEILWQRGMRHVLLVAGDFPKLTSTDYFAEIIRRLRDRGFSVAVEIAPQSTTSYAELVRAGAGGVTLYQETYNEQLYARYHPRGSKVWWDWRLEAPERAAEAGMSRLGLGVLLGLSEPRQDVLAMIRHGRYLQARFPDVALAFSLPRIHEAPDGFEPSYPVDDETFVRLYCVLRLAFPEAHLLLSTRECAVLRERLAKICITQMSAGSSTAPGGYDKDLTEQSRRQQFPLADHRSPAEVAQSLSDLGFEVCFVHDVES